MLQLVYLLLNIKINKPNYSFVSPAVFTVALYMTFCNSLNNSSALNEELFKFKAYKKDFLKSMKKLDKQIKVVETEIEDLEEYMFHLYKIM